ncbi:MAG: ABC transporter substrate-binding protein [Acidimicrobiales bacterium]|jgi:ABC-type branched-subunit amino acid transport system substrate-binding protein
MRFRITRVALASALAASLCFVGAVGLTAESASAATGTPITIALVCTCTGAGAPEYQGVPGAFRARVDFQNANGGVNGHKISTLVLDDQTSPTQASTAVQEAVSHGVLGIVSVSALFFEGAKYAQQAGIPVTGSFQDGPEWGQQPYTNMFAADNGSVDPKYPVNTGIGKFFVSHGGNVIGSYGYGISPSSTRAAIATVQSVIHAGGKQGVLDTSVPFGGSDFTTAALVAKSKNVNGLSGAMDDNSNFALATALKQAGVKLKAVVFPTGYEPNAITSPVWQDLQGDYFSSLFRPYSLPNAGTDQMQAALQKYDGFTKTQFPTFEQYEAWVGADLMMKGLQLAGKNPTSANVITSLRNVKSYNANGLLPITINYSTIFGHNPPKTCGWYLQAQSKGYVPVSSQPMCGTDLPGTSTATAS